MILHEEHNGLFFFSSALCCPPMLKILVLLSYLPLFHMGGVLRVAGD